MKQNLAAGSKKPQTTRKPESQRTGRPATNQQLRGILQQLLLFRKAYGDANSAPKP
jgi:hypothetical protein